MKIEPGQGEWSEPTQQEIHHILRQRTGPQVVGVDIRHVAGREANGENAHRFRRNLIDPGSCQVPKGETITLAEWKNQQHE